MLDLEALVTEGVDWEREGRVDPVVCPKLGYWYAVDFSAYRLPPSRSVEWPSSVPPSLGDNALGLQRKTWLAVGSGIAVAALFVAAFSYVTWTKEEGENGESNGRVGVKTYEFNCVVNNEFKVCELTADEFETRCEAMEIPECSLANAEELSKDIEGSRFSDSELFAEVLVARGAPDVDMDVYFAIFSFRAGIRESWAALKNLRGSEKGVVECRETESVLWDAEQYDCALAEVREFLNSVKGKDGYLERKLLLPEFHAVPNDGTIKDHVRYFNRAELLEGKIADEYVAVFDELLNLESEVPRRGSKEAR
jgi:hypothetical protein